MSSNRSLSEARRAAIAASARKHCELSNVLGLAFREAQQDAFDVYSQLNEDESEGVHTPQSDEARQSGLVALRSLLDSVWHQPTGVLLRRHRAEGLDLVYGQIASMYGAIDLFVSGQTPTASGGFHETRRISLQDGIDVDLEIRWDEFELVIGGFVVADAPVQVLVALEDAHGLAAALAAINGGGQFPDIRFGAEETGLVPTSAKWCLRLLSLEV
jgi:hypothetical protein